MKQQIDEIFAIGFNHKRTSTKERGAISIGHVAIQEIYDQCSKLNISNVCVLNTCNRVELYGKSHRGEVLDIFLNTLGIHDIDKGKIIVLEGVHALEHIYRVCCGLESQIVGDFEILSQFKLAFKETKKRNQLDGYMERLVDTCLQTAKEVRSSTEITSGTISTSYAAVRLLKQQDITPDVSILVVGIGNLGKSIARNIRTYFPDNTLTVINRNKEKAQLIANELGCKYALITSLNQEVNEAGVVIATLSNLIRPIIGQEALIEQKQRTFIDLSIPTAIDDDLRDHSLSVIYDLDKVSDIINTSLEERKKYIPIVEDIIERKKQEFITWSSLYEKRAIIKKWEQKIDDWMDKNINEKSTAELLRIKKNKVSEFVLYLKNSTTNLSNEDILLEFEANINSGN